MFPQLQVLLWMHYISRKRRIILTLVELASPTLLIILLFIIKDNLIADGSHSKDPDIVINDPFPTKGFISDKLVYYPKTVASQKLMSNINNDLRIKDQDIIGKNNESDSLELMQKVTRRSAFIAFGPSMDLVDTIPNNLEYTLRMKLPAVSSISEDDVYTRHTEYATTYEPFMAVQWALNKRYIRELTQNQKPEQDLYTAEMPFVKARAPKYKEFAMMLESCCKTSLLIPFLCLMTKLVTFRLTGIQELLKINGVDPKYLSLSYILNALPIGIVYALVITILLKVTATPFVPNSNPLLIFLVLMLHFLTIAGFAYLCSFFPSNMEYLTTLAILMYCLLWLPMAFLDYSFAVRRRLLFLYTFLPHGPLSWFIAELEVLESGDAGVSFTTMFESHSSRSYSVCMALLASILQLIILSQLVKYLNQVRPGPYGTARPYNFLWKSKSEPKTDAEMEQLVRDERYFQPSPTDKVVGVHIENVTKIFRGGKAALNDVSFDVYQGEITVLLGHNGAGKTTLMSIITGLLSPTSGTVRVDGLDVAQSKEEVRRKLGLCPQHNQFIPDLNVLEHVMFFAMLKGIPMQKSKESSLRLLSELNIDKQAYYSDDQLSGGMKRRLQLGCALAGDAATVILDEPTSGLDIETRRDLWDLLLSFRGKRTILITTHFMEEAEALGDRLLLLAQGAVGGHASPWHLKKHCGSGYQLLLRTNSDHKHTDILKAIQEVSGEATIKQHMSHSITFNLPIEDVSKYSAIFTVLENKMEEFDILSMGLSMPTLEEVFLKLHATVNSEPDDTYEDIQREYPRRTGLKLLQSQFFVLIKRLILHIMHTFSSFLVIQVIMPVLVIVLITYITNTTAIDPIETEDLEINLNIFKDHQKPIVFMDLQDYRNTNWDVIEKKYSFVTFINSSNITADVIDYGKQSFGKYRQILFGIWRNQEDNQFVIYYSTLVRYAGPVAIDLLSNMLVNDITPTEDGVKGPFVIKTHCKALTEGVQVAKDADKLKFPSSIFSMLFWSIFVCTMVMSGVSGSVSLASQERVQGSRLGLQLCGAAAGALWGARLGLHVPLYCAALLLPTLAAQAGLQPDRVYGDPSTAGALFFTLFLGMLAYLAFCYWMSFYFSSRATLVLGLIELIGLFLGLIQTLNTTFSQHEGQASLTKYATQITEVFLTPQTFLIAMIKVGMVANKNALCTLNMETCPDALIVLGAEEKRLCCEEKTLPYSYFDTKAGTSYNLILLTAQFVVYMVIIYLLETGVFSFIVERIKVSMTKHNGRIQRVGVLVDDIIKKERDYVKKFIEKKSNEIPDAMLVNDLHKVYLKFMSSVQVVNGVSFSVKQGEIFGILGVNGAGKSTTFKMIAAETFPTVGKLYSSGYHLSLGTRSKYMKTIGYCSQFEELDGFMTGEQYIKMLLILRGYHSKDITNIMNTWFHTFGLDQHKHKLISQLSGGCKRRLSSLAAVSVQGGVCVLDEPSSGVDVAARRRVWAALSRARRHAPVLISSHSLDEMETLCDRIAILCDGEIKAIGTPADLKTAHGAGYNLIFNLTHSATLDDKINLKSRMEKDFNCILKDEHMTMLRYRIVDAMPYSVLFKNLEQLKDEYPLIEEYVVLQNTLEDAFLSFSKKNESV